MPSIGSSAKRQANLKTSKLRPTSLANVPEYNYQAVKGLYGRICTNVTGISRLLIYYFQVTFLYLND